MSEETRKSTDRPDAVPGSTTINGSTTTGTYATDENTTAAEDHATTEDNAAIIRAHTARLEQLAKDLQNPDLDAKINKLGRTLKTWTTPIANWCIAPVSNGPTESVNNLIKRLKRTARGFTNFENYRIRMLLYTNKPNPTLLNT